MLVENVNGLHCGTYCGRYNEHRQHISGRAHSANSLIAEFVVDDPDFPYTNEVQPGEMSAMVRISLDRVSGNYCRVPYLTSLKSCSNYARTTMIVLPFDGSMILVPALSDKQLAIG